MSSLCGIKGICLKNASLEKDLMLQQHPLCVFLVGGYL